MWVQRGRLGRRAHAGFTLLELTILIGIIALLTALIASYVSKSWNVARRVNCMSNMRQVAVGYFQYAAANDGGLPLCDPDQVVMGRSSDALTDLPYLRQYVGDSRVFHCPEDLRGDIRTYAVNDYLGGQYLAITHVRLLQLVRNAPSTLLLIEEQSPASRNAFAGGFVILAAPAPIWADTPAVLHESGTCLCMADGHVEYWRWEDSRTLSLPQSAFPRTPKNNDLVKLQAIAGSSASTVN